MGMFKTSELRGRKVRARAVRTGTMIERARVFEFTHRLPPSLNQMYRRAANGRMYKTDAATQYQQGLATIARVLGGLAGPFANDCELHITVYPDPTAPERDLDNYLKAVLDGLEGVVYANDRQVKRLTIEEDASAMLGSMAIHVMTREAAAVAGAEKARTA